MALFWATMRLTAGVYGVLGRVAGSSSCAPRPSQIEARRAALLDDLQASPTRHVGKPGGTMAPSGAGYAPSRASRSVGRSVAPSPEMASTTRIAGVLATISPIALMSLTRRRGLGELYVHGLDGRILGEGAAMSAGSALVAPFVLERV